MPPQQPRTACTHREYHCQVCHQNPPRALPPFPFSVVPFPTSQSFSGNWRPPASRRSRPETPAISCLAKWLHLRPIACYQGWVVQRIADLALLSSFETVLRHGWSTRSWCLATQSEGGPRGLNRPGSAGGDVPRVLRCRHSWFQATGWADWCGSSNSIGVRMPRADWRRCRLWKISR
jgi:hypothetical protein